MEKCSMTCHLSYSMSSPTCFMKCLRQAWQAFQHATCMCCYTPFLSSSPYAVSAFCCHVIIWSTKRSQNLTSCTSVTLEIVFIFYDTQNFNTHDGLYSVFFFVWQPTSWINKRINPIQTFFFTAINLIFTCTLTYVCIYNLLLYICDIHS
jgi:hypothetical protein